MTQQIKSLPAYDSLNLKVGVLFSQKLVSKKRYDLLGWFMIILSVLIYILIGPVLSVEIDARFLYPLAWFLFPAGIIWVIYFQISKRKIHLKLFPQEQSLVIEQKQGDLEFNLKGSRFRWSYGLPSKKFLDFPAKNNGNTISPITLNLELLTIDGKKILLYHDLPWWKKRPTNWTYFYERDHLSIKSYELDYAFLITGGLLNFKKQIDLLTH